MRLLWNKTALILFLVTFVTSLVFGAKLASGKALPTPPGYIADTPVSRKVLMLTFNPIIESHGGVHLNTLQAWSNPNAITTNLLNGFGPVSHNYLKYKIVEKQEIDGYPVKMDGFQYTDETYLACLQDTSTCHGADTIDYQLLFSTYNVCTKGVDEVWLWGAPYFGYEEFNPVNFCGKTIFVMGFSYERAAAEAWHDFGHRMEFVNINRVGQDPWQQDESNEWNKFSLINNHCGNIHYPPGTIPGLEEYKYDKSEPVSSDCYGYLNFPSGPFQATTLTCSSWGCSQEGYVRWWLNHIPSSPGTTISYGKTIYNNWWKYYAFYDETAPAPAPTPTPSPTPVPGQFSNLSSVLEANQATFNFNYSSSSSSYSVDLSTTEDMSWDTYLSFSSGPASPIIEADPVNKWANYTCGATLYWVVRTDTNVLSPIQTAVVTCN